MTRGRMHEEDDRLAGGRSNDQPKPDSESTDWSPVMTKKEMASCLEMSRDRLDSIIKAQPGLVRRIYHTAYQLRLDLLSPSVRRRFEELWQSRGT